MTAAHDAEPFGDERLITAQLAFHANRSWLRRLPDSFEQGRTFGFLNVDPSTLVARVVSARAPHRLLVNTQTSQSREILHLLEEIGYAVSAPLTLMTGATPDVIPACLRNIDAIGLQQAMSLVRIDGRSSRDLVQELQMLQSALGVTPLPGWFMRGTELSLLTLAILDSNGVPIGVGSIQAIGGLGRHAHTAMGLAICVSSSHQGRGLGTLLNSWLLATGLAEFRAGFVQEIVDDPAGSSRRMYVRCGLHNDYDSHYLYAERSD